MWSSDIFKYAIVNKKTIHEEKRCAGIKIKNALYNKIYKGVF